MTAETVGAIDLNRPRAGGFCSGIKIVGQARRLPKVHLAGGAPALQRLIGSKTVTHPQLIESGLGGTRTRSQRLKRALLYH
jgi:hypothetical protein